MSGIEQDGTDEILRQNELCILKTDKDKYGHDLSEMSDFLGGYIQQLSRNLTRNSEYEALHGNPMADFSMLTEVLCYAKSVMSEKCCFIPDFDSLSADIREKLKNGQYKLGESRQVENNVRAVIVDENNVRVKDVTLKKVIKDTGTIDTLRSLSVQMQLKQISQQLVAIQRELNYQTELMRGNSIRTPFFLARGYILEAQETTDDASRSRNLHKACEKLRETIGAIYGDIDVASDDLIRNTKKWLFKDKSAIKRDIRFITQDFEVLTVAVGLLAQVADYLGDKACENVALEQYRREMLEFFTEPVCKERAISMAQLIHEWCDYTDSNLNCWLKLSERVQRVLSNTTNLIAGRDVIVIALEDRQSGR
ncbi:MAG: hypothetical protein MR399_10970 [Clostridiales bacterium]|nr:hypothetical protein [Clostridiales bacterium]